MKSFEGKPIVDDHPPHFLRPENWSAYARGHVQNVRKGPHLESGEQTVVADLVINDRALIEKIRNGKRELSCGYECEYVALQDGTFEQSSIRGNHVAVVTNGRAGVRIEDSMKKKRLTTDEKIEALLEKFVLCLQAQDARQPARDVRTHAERVGDVEAALFEQRLENEVDPDVKFGQRAREIAAKMRGKQVPMSTDEEHTRFVCDGEDDGYESLLKRRRRELLGR